MLSKFAKQKFKSRKMSSMKRWKDWAALGRPKDMSGNSNKANGVMIAVFSMSSGLTGI